MTAVPKPLGPLRLGGRALIERNDKIDARETQRCARCGVFISENGSRHHRKLKSRGGGDEVSNGVLMCGSGTTGCHGWAHAYVLSAALEGFIVASHADPREVPILHAIHGLILLDDDGGWERAA